MRSRAKAMPENSRSLSWSSRPSADAEGPVSPAGVSGLGDLRIQGDRAEKRNAHVFGDASAAAGPENRSDFSAFRAGESAHVLNDPENGNVELTAERDRFADIHGRHLLGRRHDHRPIGPADQLANGQRLVSGPRGRVDDQDIQFSPGDVRKELPDDVHFHRSPPDDGIVLAFKEKAERHDLEPVPVDGDKPVLSAVDGDPLEPEHRRNARAVLAGRPALRQRGRRRGPHAGRRSLGSAMRPFTGAGSRAAAR